MLVMRYDPHNDYLDRLELPRASGRVLEAAAQIAKTPKYVFRRWRLREINNGGSRK
jgi:hypothetical protein